MQLFLDSYGASLRVSNGMFRVATPKSEPRMIPVREVNALFLAKGVFLSTDALMLAEQNNIPVVILDGIGHPVGLLWSARHGSIAGIRKKQALFSGHPDGWVWVRDLLLNRLEMQRIHLNRLAEMGAHSEDFQKKYKRIQGLFNYLALRFETWELNPAISNEQNAKTLRGLEGTASRYYFACLSAALPPHWQFQGRSRRPSADPFNAALNYAYGILYAQVELALLKAGLDPYMGILHVDRHGGRSMVFDMIENSRHWAEQCVVGLFRDEKFTEDCFMPAQEGEGLWLSPEGKNVLIPAFLGYLKQPEGNLPPVRKRSVKLDMSALTLATKLKDWQPTHI